MSDRLREIAAFLSGDYGERMKRLAVEALEHLLSPQEGSNNE